jgi:hypothetical protein
MTTMLPDASEQIRPRIFFVVHSRVPIEELASVESIDDERFFCRYRLPVERISLTDVCSQ